MSSIIRLAIVFVLLSAADHIDFLVGAAGPSRSRPNAARWTSSLKRDGACPLKNPVPTNLPCGIRGHVKGTPLLPYHDNEFAQKQTVPSLNACKTLCTDRTVIDPKDYEKASFDLWCTGFSYNSKTKICQLHDVDTLKRRGIVKNESSANVIYDVNCFDCSFPCPQHTQKNLLSDGSFEISDQFIGPWGRLSNYGPYVAHPGDHSDNAIICNARDICEIRQNRRLCPNQKYSIAMDIKVYSNNASIKRSTSPQVNIKVGDLTIKKPIDWSEAFHSPSGWRTLQASFLGIQDEEYADYHGSVYDFPSNIHVSFELSDGVGEENGTSAAGIYMDNFKLIPLSGGLKLTGKNLLQNPGFESGKIAPWRNHYYNEYLPYYYYYYEDSHPGKQSIVSPGLTAGSKFAYKYTAGFLANFDLSQNVTLKKGKSYLLSYDYKNKAYQPDLVVRYSDGSRQAWDSYLRTGYVYRARRSLKDDDSVQTFSRTFRAMEDQAIIKLQIQGGKDQNKKSDFIYLDNIILKELA